MKLHHDFEWDPAKEKINKRKHKGITFALTAAALGDEFAERYHVTDFDLEHSDDRYEEEIQSRLGD